MMSEIDEYPKLCKAPLFYRQWEIISDPSRFINVLIREFGDFIHYRGLINFYLINNATLIKKVLNETHRNFDKNTVIGGLGEFNDSLNGEINSNGTEFSWFGFAPH